MNKRTVVIAGLGLILAAVYLTYFTDWRKPKKIQILWRVIPAGALGPAHPAVVGFYLGRPFALTSVKVVEAAEAATNKYPHALWDLIATANPPMTTAFNYGEPISGMTPKIATAQPETLEPGDDYLIRIEAANHFKGEKSFSIHD